MKKKILIVMAILLYASASWGAFCDGWNCGGTVTVAGSDGDYQINSSGSLGARTPGQVRSNLGVVETTATSDGNIPKYETSSGKFIPTVNLTDVNYYYAPPKTSATGVTYTAADSGKVNSNYNQSGAKTDYLPAASSSYSYPMLFMVDTTVAQNWDLTRQGSDTIALHKGDGTMSTGKTYIRINNTPVNCVISCLNSVNRAVWVCSLSSATTCTGVTTD